MTTHPQTLAARLARRAIPALTVALLGLGGEGRAETPAFRLASFSADVTIPIGHACMGGGIAPAREVLDPLLARGVVLLGGDQPVVIVAVDWCEIRNEAYDRWREALAEAAGTTRERVLLSSIHQHDAPVADLEAERLLVEAGGIGSVCDLDFHDEAVRRVAEALKASLAAAGPITHYGTGMARVDQVASNRRTLDADGRPNFGRGSATRDPELRARPEGTIDPYLRTLSFWDGDTPVAVLSVYATHPMSHYGGGMVSSDFVGQARAQRQEATPGTFQMYLSGCSGNVTAGRHNDGAPENRAVLAGRIADAMADAWENTRRHPLTAIGFRSVPLRLTPRDDEGFTVEDLTRRLRTDERPFGRCLAAMGLSWRERCERGQPIDLPVIDLGGALFALLPGESYVEYQLLAQKIRPDAFVVVAGYGECATGYIPTDQAVAENDTNLHDWCWVAPGAERAMTEALEAALRP